MQKIKLIECKNLCLSYDSRNAVTNASFSIESGDYLSVLGENGSGKSTLIKALLGLKNPDSGKISFNGIEPKQIGYLPQQTNVQRDFPATVQEVVLSGCLNRSGIFPFYSRNQKVTAKTNMEKLNITDISKKSYRELSGGQQQRVLLARALCATEKMLLLDEPVTGLDPVAKADFYNIIQHINKKHGITIIMITHDIDSALKYSSKILHMKNKVMFFGETEKYFGTDLCKMMIGGASNE